MPLLAHQPLKVASRSGPDLSAVQLTTRSSGDATKQQPNQGNLAYGRSHRVEYNHLTIADYHSSAGVQKAASAD